MKNRMSIPFVLILLGWLIIGCSGPKTMMAEREGDCGCGRAITFQEDMEKMVLEDIFTRIGNE